jgi:hypothetical protein
VGLCCLDLPGAAILVDLLRPVAKVVAVMARKHFKAKAGALGHGKLNQMRTNVLKLSAACPFHVANPADCPLFELRKLPPSKRLQWVDALSETDLEYLATYHRVCIRIKTRSRSTPRETKARINPRTRKRGGRG